ncbi:MAG TPA: DNA-formamidopyrimidine glycosylase family protein [Candidatus Babeliales bacterium]|nr:DNA-formamidopyrimidine glycosylase family protein [Candidatus Babeliales bacterium]
MPELPELEAFKWYVKEHCLNKVISQVTSTDARVIKAISLTTFKKDIVHNKFSNADRRGKYLIISLSPSEKKLVIHFALTGSLEFIKKKDLKTRFSAVSFIFKDHSVLHFKSVRKFEKIWLVDNTDQIKGITQLGPDALNLSNKDFTQIALAKKKKNVKSFLMDQKLIAGIGNEYTDEILFQSNIDPHHRVGDLSEAQLKTIYKEMRKILLYAIKLRIKNIKKSVHDLFSDESSKRFKSSYLQSHRHIDMICPKNRNHKLKKTSIAGRSTYYCPKDQV